MKNGDQTANPDRLDELKLDKTYFVLALSDVHLGHHIFGDDSAKQFMKLLTKLENTEGYEISNFIILGDFLDFWRDDDERIFEKYETIIQRLIGLKSKKKIGKLHYVVGNHDYLIPYYRAEERFNDIKVKDLLQEFEVYSPSVKDPEALRLIPPKATNMMIEFKHSHQEEAKALGPIYDWVCVGLCKQGKDAGNFTSIIFKYKFEIAMIAFGIASLIAYFRNDSTLSAFLLIGMILTLILGFVHRRIESIEKQVYHTMRKSASTKRKQKLEKLSKKKDFESRMKAKLVKQVPDIESLLFREKRDTISVPVNVKVLGHTHKLVVVGSSLNTGAWVEGNRCGLLTITNDGSIKMNSCIVRPPRHLRTKLLRFSQRISRW